MLSRDNVTKKEIPGRLLEGNQIWKNICDVVARYKQMDKQSGGGTTTNSLFGSKFDDTMAAQEYHVLNCIGDPLINDKHYLEMEDGNFVLLRGTNRNESYHRRINHLFPDKCAKTLSDSLRIAHTFHWNFNRYYSGEELCFDKMDYRSISGISTLDHCNVLQNHVTTSGPFMNKSKVTFSNSNSNDMLSSRKNYLKPMSFSKGSHKSSLRTKSSTHIHIHKPIHYKRIQLKLQQQHLPICYKVVLLKLFHFHKKEPDQKKQLLKLSPPLLVGKKMKLKY